MKCEIVNVAVGTEGFGINMVARVFGSPEFDFQKALDKLTGYILNEEKRRRKSGNKELARFAVVKQRKWPRSTNTQ